MRVIAALLPLLLAACAEDLPPANPRIAGAGEGPGPRLLPLDPILARAAAEPRAAAEGEALDARRTRLEERAVSLDPPAPVGQTRAQSLRERAEALRNAPL
jgi:hypothetical protein